LVTPTRQDTRCLTGPQIHHLTAQLLLLLLLLHWGVVPAAAAAYQPPPPAVESSQGPAAVVRQVLLSQVVVAQVADALPLLLMTQLWWGLGCAAGLLHGGSRLSALGLHHC
jgi:hypothetical protein